MLLRQISPNDPVSALALEGLEESAPILSVLQFFQKGGDSATIKKERTGTAKTKITRSVNEDNTATPPTNTYPAIAKKIVSVDAKVDVVLEDRNESPEEELAKQTKIECYEAGFVLQALCFNGDEGADAENFDGMRNLVDAGNVYTEGSADGQQVPVGSSDANVSEQQKAIEALLQFFEKVRGGATDAFMPNGLKVRWLTVAKALGFYRQSKDEIGNLIDKINDTTIHGAGYKKDGTSILQFNETVGASTDCASVFAVHMGEGVNFTALTSVGVKGRYAGQVGNFLINNVNLDMALVIQADAALHQSKGWRL